MWKADFHYRIPVQMEEFTYRIVKSEVLEE